jgi:hypothetical protein
MLHSDRRYTPAPLTLTGVNAQTALSSCSLPVHDPIQHGI